VEEVSMCNRRIVKSFITCIGLPLIIGLAVGSAFAQQIEIHPYAGGFFPAKWSDTARIRTEGIYGVRAGVYLMDFVQLDVNYGYINHFTFKNATNSGLRAYIWDINGSYSLTGYTTSLGNPIRKLEPFVTVGAGGLTTGLHDASKQRASTPSLPLKDNDSFFQFTYGAGVKAPRLMGPIGLRADVRGRTMPNFYGRGQTWLEATGGINVMWGER
jgi:outer membrane protein with beta-barrel domain